MSLAEYLGIISAFDLNKLSRNQILREDSPRSTLSRKEQRKRKMKNKAQAKARKRNR